MTGSGRCGRSPISRGQRSSRSSWRRSWSGTAAAATSSAGSCCGWCWPCWSCWPTRACRGASSMRGPVLGLLVIPLIPAAVTVAILRYQLLDIRLVVSRSLVYGVLTAAAAGVYAGLVALLDALVRSRVSLGTAVAASVVVAVGFNPARVRLQRLIDRALYGDRRDPVRAVSLVGERLAGSRRRRAAGRAGGTARFASAAVRGGAVRPGRGRGTRDRSRAAASPLASAMTASASASWSSGCARGSGASARRTSRCSSCWPARSLSPCTPPPCPPRCRSRASASWRRGRRSAAGSGGIFMMASVPS